MSANAQLTYQRWLDSRNRQVHVAGIDIRLRIVSPGILKSSGADLLRLLDGIDEWQFRNDLSRRDLALMMRDALEVILPKVLESPDWLMQALNDFSENEIIELYNVVMYGTDTVDVGEIPF